MWTVGSSSLKKFVDRGVQTSPSLISQTKGNSKSAVSQELNISPSQSSAHLLSDHSFHSAQYDSAYSHSLPEDDPGPLLSVSQRRAYKYQHIAQHVPSPIRKESGRIVSLPETEPMYTTKTALESTTLRVVSMPERRRSSLSFTASSPSSTHADVSRGIDASDLSRTEEYPGNHIRSRSHDMPRTPSPPSSPESVLIIANNSQFPDIFLRNRKIQEDLRASPDDDDGWITWTNSPPRPIPALHGPLSLPYARCPSGAEGTIIEEQDHLPRVIWGLGSGDANFGRTHSASAPQPAFQSSTPQKIIPPRLQKTRAQVDANRLPSSQSLSSTAHITKATSISGERHEQHIGPSNTVASQELDNHRPLYASGPMHTSLQNPVSILNPSTDMDYSDSHSRLTDNQYLPKLSLEEGLRLEWQAILSRNRLRSSGSGTGTEELAHYLKATAPAFVPSGSLEGLYHPRIIVEPRTTQPTRLSHDAEHRRRPTIDLTQQYLQLPHRHQSLLPTPPSTSSPLWSSNFSPYQESLLSPPDVAASLLPGLPYNIPIQLGNTGISQQLRRVGYGRAGNATAVNSDAEFSLAPPAQINAPSRSRRLPSASLDVSPSFSNYMQNQTYSNTVLSSPQAASSPPRLKVPPNTPLRAASSPRVQDSPRFTTTTMPTPPSPRSPETRTNSQGYPRSLSTQQPRSIPLAKLIQRRLSAVPEAEEDSSSARDSERSPSPPQSNSARRKNRPRQEDTLEQIYSTPPQQHQQKQRSTASQHTFHRKDRRGGTPVRRSNSGETESDSAAGSENVLQKVENKDETRRGTRSGTGSESGPRGSAPRKKSYKKKIRPSSIDSNATNASLKNEATGSSRV